MPARTIAFFWAATVAAVCFLGAAWAAWQSRADGPGALPVLLVASAGAAASAFVAGRIIVVVGRLQRDTRRRQQ